MKTIELLKAESFTLAENEKDREVMIKGWGFLVRDVVPLATTSTGDLIVECNKVVKLFEHGEGNVEGCEIDSSSKHFFSKIKLLEKLSKKIRNVKDVESLKGISENIKQERSKIYKQLPRNQYSIFWKYIFDSINEDIKELKSDLAPKSKKELTIEEVNKIGSSIEMNLTEYPKVMVRAYNESKSKIGLMVSGKIDSVDDENKIKAIVENTQSPFKIKYSFF